MRLIAECRSFSQEPVTTIYGHKKSKAIADPAFDFNSRKSSLKTVSLLFFNKLCL
jgi:hypothetical protein